MTVDINVMVGGEAGQGVQLAGWLLAKALARGGYHVFADQDYESRVRGGHNLFRVRASDRPVGAISEPVDVLVALDRASIERHRQEVTGVTVYDSDQVPDGGGENGLGVPLERLAGSKLMANTVALGVVIGLVAYDFPLIDGLLREQFGEGAVAEANVSACRAGYDLIQSEHHRAFDRRLAPLNGARRMLLNGNEAISLGAIAAGCSFMAAYPMTPASAIMEYMAAKAAEYDLVMVHAEDEIAAMNMAIGAAFAGVRAMTATSGSGFCLMAEGLGLAGITETPVVVVDGQRPGPAVGLPTRTEQGDLEFVLHAHHGEFPRAVLAPATVADAFWITVKAFNLADRYQLPVIILTDHHLASSYATVEPFELSKVTIDRGLLHDEAEAGQYMRHKVTASGISPRAFPGRGEALVVTDADEHDEAGHLTEDAATRTAQVEKRLRKLFGLKKEISPPWRYGPRRAETIIIGWGSTYGANREAVDLLRQGGISANLLHLNELWPFPAEAVSDALGSARHSYVVENNATGQLARLIRRETGREVGGRILRYDGRPFTPAGIAAAIRKDFC